MNIHKSTYFNERVLQPYIEVRRWYERCEYAQHKGVQLVSAAACALFHFNESLDADESVPLKQLNLIPDFLLCRDICNVDKHAELDLSRYKNRPAPAFLKKADIREVIYLDEHQDRDGEYYYPHIAVVLCFSDGSAHDALGALLSDNYTYPVTTTTLTHPDPSIVRDDRGTSSTQRKDPNALQRCPSEEIDGRIQQDWKNLHGGFEGRNEPQDCGKVREAGQVPIGSQARTDLEDAA